MFWIFNQFDIIKCCLQKPVVSKLLETRIAAQFFFLVTKVSGLFGWGFLCVFCFLSRYGNVLKSGLLQPFPMPLHIVLKSRYAYDRLVLLHLNFYASLNTRACYPIKMS